VARLKDFLQPFRSVGERADKEQMKQNASIESESDSLIEILTAQCADLENLLSLSKCERLAVEKNDFDGLLEVVGERATIGARLEVYHRQIAELRSRLGQAADPLMGTAAARRAVELAGDIQTQDALTRPLLLAARNDTHVRLQRLNQSHRNASAYLRESRHYAIACDERA
jgi:hypothetical protein